MHKQRTVHRTVCGAFLTNISWPLWQRQTRWEERLMFSLCMPAREAHGHEWVEAKEQSSFIETFLWDLGTSIVPPIPKKVNVMVREECRDISLIEVRADNSCVLLRNRFAAVWIILGTSIVAGVVSTNYSYCTLLDHCFKSQHSLSFIFALLSTQPIASPYGKYQIVIVSILSS